MQKEFHSYPHWILRNSTLKLLRNLKEIRKRAIPLQKTISQKFEKIFLDIHIRNVMPNFDSFRLSSVAVFAKTYIHAYTKTHPHKHILPNLGNT